MRRSARTFVPAAAFAALLAAGCASVDVTAPGDMAAGDAPIRTSATSYTLHATGGGYGVDIPIRFHNVTGRTLYIVNCHSILVPVLEKRVGDAWQPWWSGVTPLCLSPPIVIRPGEVLERTLPVWGALPGRNTMPAWEDQQIEGTYRIVMTSVVFNYRDSAATPGFGESVPLEYRVSNEFELRR